MYSRGQLKLVCTVKKWSMSKDSAGINFPAHETKDMDLMFFSLIEAMYTEYQALDYSTY